MSPRIAVILRMVQDVGGSARVDYTGAVQYWTVPAGVTAVFAKCFGASSARCSLVDDGSLGYQPTWGWGGYAEGLLSVTPGQVLNLYVGGVPGGNVDTNDVNLMKLGGWNGGGPGGTASAGGYVGFGGGGATDIRQGGTALANRKITAGGGGGSTYDRDGGTGGGTNGGAGNGYSYAGAGGATQARGGYGWAYPATTGDGTLGQGATGENNTSGGQGGGGGWYGGGGSVGAPYTTTWSGGGGGGSGNIGGVSNGLMSNGVNRGNGYILLEY